MIRFDGPTLLVDGEPFLIVGGELHNSSASSVAAIARSFATTAALGVNTILAPVAWEQFEPDEGSFDTTLVDAMLATARRLGVRLVLLWFGSWKNGMSTYAPAWVKLDQARFPRAETHARRVEVLSPFCEAARDADAAAFAALMAHLAAVDSEQQTVLMVQVENEVGLLGDARDRSTPAERAWGEPVPAAVLDAVAAHPDLPAHEAWRAAGGRREGTWAQVFGDGPEGGEAFMAAAYAAYVEHVAAAGRVAYDLPLYVNAWLAVPSMIGEIIDRAIEARKAAGEEVDEAALNAAKAAFAVEGGVRPGAYPSGGPVVRVAPIWQALAPTLDLLAPDIYAADAEPILAQHAAASGRLFIPECRRSLDGIAVMFSAVGVHGAIGCCPFGIDSLDADDPHHDALVDAFGLLRAVADATRATGTRPVGFVATAERPTAELDLGRWLMAVDTRGGGLAPVVHPAYGLVVALGADDFLVVGRGFSPVFTCTDGGTTGLLQVDELDATGATVRLLNGDETAGGVKLPALGATSPPFLPVPMPTDSTGILRVRLYTY